MPAIITRGSPIRLHISKFLTLSNRAQDPDVKTGTSWGHATSKLKHLWGYLNRVCQSWIKKKSNFLIKSHVLINKVDLGPQNGHGIRSVYSESAVVSSKHTEKSHVQVQNTTVEHPGIKSGSHHSLWVFVSTKIIQWAWRTGKDHEHMLIKDTSPCFVVETKPYWFLKAWNNPWFTEELPTHYHFCE